MVNNLFFLCPNKAITTMISWKICLIWGREYTSLGNKDVVEINILKSLADSHRELMCFPKTLL